jgi:hypothetical protein
MNSQISYPQERIAISFPVEKFITLYEQSLKNAKRESHY